MAAPLALARFKVLDLTRVRAGPTAVRQLADWGADVIMVEARESDVAMGDRDGSDFQNLHRNTRSLTLDLKHAEGSEILKKLAAGADVLVENYRPDVKERLGIDYATLSALNSRLVYASISGYGQEGPYRMRPGLDQIAQGMGGLMAITGPEGGGPVRAGAAIADIGAGLYCAIAILTALLERDVSGEGQWVHTSLLQAQIAMLDFQAARWTMDKVVPPQVGNHHPTATPMGTFPTSDGYVNVAPLGDAMWRRLAAVLGHPEWTEDARFLSVHDRTANREPLSHAMGVIMKSKSAAHWIETLNADGIPCGPIYTMDQVFADPQVKCLGMAETVHHPRLGDIDLISQPIRMSRSNGAVRTPTPDRGANNQEILQLLGYDKADIARLERDRVI